MNNYHDLLYDVYHCSFNMPKAVTIQEFIDLREHLFLVFEAI